ncbi:MAG: DUF447 family protein, partial [Methanobrevibacter sp.]|nr:DUF447 family protein [Methanobrevibacter sp.]
NAEGNEYNAAPIGVTVENENEISCQIFKGSRTSKNIYSKKEFIINITSNPIYFTLSAIGNLPGNYVLYHDDKKYYPYLKDTESYLKCKVIKIKDIIKTADPIKKTEVMFINAKVLEVVKNKNCVNPLNRAFCSLLESLVNYTRIDMVDNEKQSYFLNYLKESERMINKIGSKEEKESIGLVKDKLKEKGYKI